MLITSLEMLEMPGQLPEKILAVRVFGKVVQTLLNENIAALEVPGLLCEDGKVVVTLPHPR